MSRRARKISWCDLAVPQNCREHHATEPLQVHSPWQREKGQYDFLSQPLNLYPSITLRNSISLTSTPRVDAAIVSLGARRVVTTTFLSNVLSWTSAPSQLLQPRLQHDKCSEWQFPKSHRFLSTLSMQLDDLLSWERLNGTLKHTLVIFLAVFPQARLSPKPSLQLAHY